MPAQKAYPPSPRPLPGRPQYNDEFINIGLSAEQIAECKAWLPSPDLQADLFDRLAQESYNISVKYDADEDNYLCILRPLGDSHPNRGYLLSGRGTTALKAIRQAAYKHYRIADQQWPSYSSGRVRRELDD